MNSYSDSYFVDRFYGKLIRADERDPLAPPERYYWYGRGALSDIIIEQYVVCYKPLKIFEFSYAVDDDITFVSMQRDYLLIKYGISDRRILYSFIVPPEIYDEKIAEFEEGKLYERL